MSENLRLPIPFNMGKGETDHPILSIGSSYSALRDDVSTWLDAHTTSGWKFNYDHNEYCLWFEDLNDMNLFIKTYSYNIIEKKMKPIKINKNTWHYQVATKYTYRDIHFVESICEYNRRVFMGLAAICLIILASSLALLILLSPIFYTVLHLIYGLEFDSDSTESALIVAGIGFYMGILGIYIAHLLTEREYKKVYEMPENGIERKDSYIKSAWKSFKDKVCVKVEFE